MLKENGIGALEAEFGVTARALRFYEERGLLAPARDGETRIYGEAERAGLSIILQAKRLGFTLVEIREIVALGGVDKLPRERIAAQIEFLQRQSLEIVAAINDLLVLYRGER